MPGKHRAMEFARPTRLPSLARRPLAGLLLALVAGCSGAADVTPAVDDRPASEVASDPDVHLADDVPALARDAGATPDRGSADATADLGGPTDRPAPTDDGLHPMDVPAPPMDVPAPPMDVPAPRMDATTSDGAVGPLGGAVSRLRFGVFGDVRPPSENQTTLYPTAIVTAVMDGIASAGAQFAVANGDYMFASTNAAASAQVSLLLGAESRFPGHVFHSMGNHECNGASASNCPAGTETQQIQVYRSRLAPAYGTPYFDWVVRTDLGDAHFIAAAPNAWSPAQQAWFTAALAQPARYTVVIAHEPPGRREAPGSVAIEDAIRARPGGVTLRLYGHTHEYRHQSANAVIVGNAGAPLASATGTYGFVVVEQRADGDLVVTAYNIGRPAMVADSFVLTPAGSLTR
jgi:hypothetical protein